MAPTKILVTGGSGFIASHVISALMDAGYSVRMTTRHPNFLVDGVEVYVVHDFQQPVDWDNALEGIDAVIHIAGLAHSRVKTPPNNVYERVNWLTTRDLALAANKARIKHFIYISTVRAVIGASSAKSVSDKTAPYPVDRYGRSKRAAEVEIRSSGVPHTILRIVAVYGRGAKGNIRSLLLLSKLPVPLPFGKFHNRRSFLSIDNLISAILFVLNTPAAINQTFLVADAHPISVRELFVTLRAARRRRPALINIPPLFFRAILRLLRLNGLAERLTGELVVDTTKLQNLGWRPTVDTVSGLRAMINNTDLRKHT